MSVVSGAYNPLPAPPVAVSGQVLSFDGHNVDPGGSYIFDNNLINEYSNTFPNYIIGWPSGIEVNLHDQNTASGVVQTFI